MTDSSNEHEAENSTVPTPDNEIQDLQQEIATLKAELKEKMINT